MRVFKTKWFTRFARKEHIGDSMLEMAAREVEKGLHDGDLGRGLIKKGVARRERGQERGLQDNHCLSRTHVRSVFVYDFPKSAKANLSSLELDVYRKLAQIFLAFSDADMEKASKEGEVEEVSYGGEKEISD